MSDFLRSTWAIGCSFAGEATMAPSSPEPHICKTYLEVPVKINEILNLMRHAIRLLNVQVPQAHSALEQDLYRTIFLLLEDLVAVRRLVARHLVRGEALNPKRVGGVCQQRHDLIGPVPDVGLTHTQLDLLIE